MSDEKSNEQLASEFGDRVVVYDKVIRAMFAESMKGVEGLESVNRMIAMDMALTTMKVDIEAGLYATSKKLGEGTRVKMALYANQRRRGMIEALERGKGKAKFADSEPEEDNSAVDEMNDYRNRENREEEDEVRE